MKTVSASQIRRDRQVLRYLYHWFAAFGLNGPKLLRALRGLPHVLMDYRELKRQRRALKRDIEIDFSLPSFDDRFLPGGSASGHYFHQDLLVARKIFQRGPDKHVDVGSRVDGFVAHIASFRKIEIFDIREIKGAVPNIVVVQSDVMSSDFSFHNYCDSLSCLHAIEHFGLGRYGDSIDIDGHLDGFENLKKMLKKGGILYLSMPIGRDRIRFNGERILSVETILKLVEGEFELESFAYVDDAGNLHEKTEFSVGEIAQNFGCERGCGIFEFRKF
jgi:hypothetical protein